MGYSKEKIIISQTNYSLEREGKRGWINYAVIPQRLNQFKRNYFKLKWEMRFKGE